ncbi:MAG: ribosome small subunit-dependent GTPase A [archaeon]
MTTAKIDLKKIGWDSFFEESFSPYQLNGLVPGRIIKVQRKGYIALTETGETEVKVSGKFRFDATEKGAYPVVGDWVAIKKGVANEEGTIKTVLPRRNKFSRKVAGVTTEEQILVANVDMVWIVAGLDNEFNIQRIERYLTLVSESKSKPVVILNKSDLCDNPEERGEEVKKIAQNAPVHILSAKLNQGLDALDQYLEEGKTIAILGSSGVGKSTILNQLLGVDRQEVGEVRETDGHGRHITAYRELFMMPKGGMIIDNPGVREMQLWSKGEGISEMFRDVEEIIQQCKFTDCNHENAPDCAVKEALDTGKLDPRRYAHYLKLKQEVEVLAIKQKNMVRRAEKTKWKDTAKQGREIRKYRTREVDY